MTIGAQFMSGGLRPVLGPVGAGRPSDAGYGTPGSSTRQILWQDVYVYMTRARRDGPDRRRHGGHEPVHAPPVTSPRARFATLAQLHPGRLMLGIGRGDSAVRTMGLNPVPTTFLRESDPDPARLHGGRRKLNDTDVHFRWVDEDARPDLLSATGPKNLRAAGALADRRDALRRRQPGVGRWAIGHVRAGAERPAATRPGRDRRSRSSPPCGSPTTRRRPGRSAAGRPPPARTTSRTR